MTPEVKAAIDEIAAHFPNNKLIIEEDGQGGGVVKIYSVSIGSQYRENESWFGFQITHTYPYADIYPHFLRHDLSRIDGNPLGEGMSVGTFQQEPAIQISRRSNRLNPATDTALLKLLKVLRWLNSR